MSDPTITQNLGLYRAQHAKALRELRRELRKLERRAWSLKIYVKDLLVYDSDDHEKE